MGAQVQANPTERVSVDRSSQIGLREESDLEWYFGPGEAVFHRSTFGAMLDQIEGDAHISKPCPRCSGIGFTDEDLRMSTAILKRHESLRAEDWEAYQFQAEKCQPRCACCSGIGDIPVRKRASREALTARPRKNQREGGGYTPPDWALTRYATVSRRLDMVRAESPKHAAVLAAYYGDTGARWGRTRHGRIFAVYALTNSGRKLLERTHVEGDQAVKMSASERLGVQADLDKSQPKQNRRQLLDAADKQAREAHAAASRAWNATRRQRQPETAELFLARLRVSLPAVNDAQGLAS